MAEKIVVAKLVNLPAAGASLHDGCVREGNAETLGDGETVLEVVQRLVVAGRDRRQPTRRERPLELKRRQQDLLSGGRELKSSLKRAL
ncbi:unnamed protein product [Vitrella brassicaformis CCMP3155]|uniref:Uncharacterized protein n=1 Tax=Vitrella brassicaformis (strain CCMP3155) TaxID=1169540 RepID=A0A0G4GP37_VITBC|nr:unnamed protein product [Vitrella brassicaformis CCMP3155]|eukprot:CEM32042.1 unnamed protein product [Vitrella brassicaformis CCMP3155]